MPPILRLEYACTSAELDQAQSLSLRQQLGGGSKWRARLVLYLVAVGLLLGALFRFEEIPEIYRALLLIAVVAGGTLSVILQRRFRKPVQSTSHVEISEENMTILGADSKAVLPWSAFSRLLESPELFVLMDRSKQTLLVFPKRVFPSEDWQTWFREHAHYALLAVPEHRDQLQVAAAAAHAVTITFNRRFWDYVGCTLASWFTWGACAAVGAMLLGVSVNAAANPPPNPVHSDAEVFFFFTVPLFLVFVVMIVALFSAHRWRLAAKHAWPQEMAFSDESVAFSSADASCLMPWTRFKHYKETPWNFILWRRSFWVMLPKRAFASWDDIGRCRELLEKHLARSRWFFG